MGAGPTKDRSEGHPDASERIPPRCKPVPPSAATLREVEAKREEITGLRAGLEDRTRADVQRKLDAMLGAKVKTELSAIRTEITTCEARLTTEAEDLAALQTALDAVFASAT